MADRAEKRRHHRFLALLEVRVLPGEGIPADLKMVTIDVAVGGARCASNRPLPESTRLQMSLTLVGGSLRDPSPIDLDAVVLRCAANPSAPETRRYDLAIEFVRMDPQDRRRLQTYLNAL